MSSPGKEDGPDGEEPSLKPEESRQRSKRQRFLTPEQRRHLATSRPASAAQTSSEQTGLPDSAATDENIAEEIQPTPKSLLPEGEPAFETEDSESDSKPRPSNLGAHSKAAREIELRHAVMVIACFVFLCAIFYAGKKFEYVKYLIVSRKNADSLEAGPDKFPGLSYEELMETGLAAEKRGDWPEAVDRFLTAKRKNLTVPGILFHIGKGSFDRGDLDGADTALDHAIKFGENLPVANQLRALIAVRRHDLPAATRLFEAATAAEPFVADLFYYLGETLRLDQHPREAIQRYQQAIQRTPSTQDTSLCEFKIRLARIEASDAASVAAEVEEARRAGQLSVPWLMIDAALQLHAGNVSDAGARILEARSQGLSGLFLTCAGDTMFQKAGETHPEIAPLVAMPTPPPAP